MAPQVISLAAIMVEMPYRTAASSTRDCNSVLQVEDLREQLPFGNKAIIRNYTNPL